MHPVAFALGIVLALLAARPASTATVVINNGLAPPNPDNVIEAANSFPVDSVYVQNVGCNATLEDPCAMPGDPTSVELTAGGSVGLDLRAYESSSVTMSGGSVGANLAAFDSSAVTMSGGSVAEFLDALGSSTVTLSGGSVGLDLAALDSSAVTMSGGALGGVFYAYASSTITIVGTDFMVNGVPVGFGPIEAMSGRLTGTLASGEPIDNVFCHDGCQAVLGKVLVTFNGLITLAEPETALMFPVAMLSLVALRGRRRTVRPTASL